MFIKYLLKGSSQNGVLIGCRNHSDQSPKLKVSKKSNDFFFFTGAIKKSSGLGKIRCVCSDFSLKVGTLDDLQFMKVLIRGSYFCVSGKKTHRHTQYLRYCLGNLGSEESLRNVGS